LWILRMLQSRRQKKSERQHSDFNCHATCEESRGAHGLMDDLGTILVTLLSLISPPPLLIVHPDELVVWGRMGMVIAGTGIFGALLSRVAKLPGIVGIFVGLLAGLTAATIASDGAVVMICACYAVVARMADGLVCGFALRRLLGRLRGHRLSVFGVVPSGPEAATVVMACATGFAIRSLVPDLKDSESAIFLIGATVLALGGLLVAPAMGTGYALAIRLVFPLFLFFAFLGGAK
jgi:hypothetical protein